MHLFEKTVDSQVIYEGKIITLKRDTALLENGAQVTREVIVHPGGVGIVPVTEEGELLLVRQFRYPHGKVLLEIPAGKLNWGEDPFECGKRELLEETGCTAEEYTFLGELYPTPAYLNEVLYLYMAKGLHYREQNLDEDEFLDVVRVPLDEAVEMVMRGDIPDAKSQAAILKVKLMGGMGNA